MVPTSRRFEKVTLLPCEATVICRGVTLPATEPSRVHPAGTASVIVHDVPTGTPAIVAVPLALFDAVIVRLKVPAAPQSATKSNEPDTGSTEVPVTAFVMTRSAV